MAMAMHIEEGDWKTLQHDCERVRLMVFVAEQHVPKEEELDEWDAKSRHFIARDAQHMVMGCARLLPTGQIGRLAVLKPFRKRGVGGALIARGHELARSLGYAFSVVLGSEGYYPRFGYVPASRFGIRAPFEVPEENFMACRLLPGAAAPEGVAEYAAPFTAGDG